MPVLPSEVFTQYFISKHGAITGTKILSKRAILNLSLGRKISSSAILSREHSCETVQVKPACVPTCEIKRPPKPPCKTPKQKLWQDCDRICLPCCDKISTPITCDTLDIKTNYCKKEEYRLPSYSECNKDYNIPRRKKECCYHTPICHMGNLAERELKPLLRIKDRQALVLGKERH